MKTGDILEMNIVRLESNEYGSRFILKYGDRDTYRVKAYDFQVEGDITGTIQVRVSGIDPMTGFPNLVQDNNWVLRQTYVHYGLIDRNYEFEIIDKRVDGKTNRLYYCLKDEFGIRIHRYYTNDEYSVGDRIRLHIKELGDNHLVLEKPKERTRISNENGLIFTTRENMESHSEPTTIDIQKVVNNTFKFMNDENQHLEYKSSIAFNSRTSCQDIDKQMRTILKSIAGFMNADGGILYIGVKDNGEVRGIEEDYLHLNTGRREVDEYSGQYKEDADGFENKIRNSVSQYLSSLASALFKFTIETYNGKSVAKIEIEKAYTPIYYNGHIVFQRQGNRTITLKDNMLTHFCASKWFGAKSPLEKNGIDVPKKSEKNQIDDANDIRDYSIWHTMHLHQNGGWSFDNKAHNNPHLNDVVHTCKIEKYRAKEKHLLLLAYKSGNVNVVKLEKDGDGWNNKKGWGINGYYKEHGLQSVYCANPMDMVAVFYEKENNTFVKIVDIGCISDHSQLSNKGNDLVPDGAKDCKIFHIHHKYHDALRGLTRSTRNYAGYDIDNNSKVRTIIQKLQEIVRDEYGVVFE